MDERAQFFFPFTTEDTHWASSFGFLCASLAVSFHPARKNAIYYLLEIPVIEAARRLLFLLSVGAWLGYEDIDNLR